MTELPTPPEVDQTSGYSGQLWPTASPLTTNGSSGPAPGKRRGRRPLGTATLAVLLIALATFLFAAGFAVADSRARAASNLSSPAVPARTYEQGVKAGRDTGYEQGYRVGEATGFRAGKKEGFENGHTKGQAAGRVAGYRSGFADGKRNGYRGGLVEGCEAVFTELETNKVLDRTNYWYLTRDQCKWAGTWRT